MNVAVSIARAKAMALLLGPAGVGLVGLYGSILDLTQSIAGMGINSSGVRQIAEAAGSGETRRGSRGPPLSCAGCRSLLGLLGAVLLIVFCRPVSQWTFGSDELRDSGALLSLAVFCRAISDGQAALIQGMRRIADLARIGVLGGALRDGRQRRSDLLPSARTASCRRWWASRGITLVISWWFRRRDPDPAGVPDGRSELQDEASALLKLGVAFMASAVLTTGAAYAIRTLLGNTIGARGGGAVPVCLGIGRAVCRLHPAGDGQRFLSAADGRRRTITPNATASSTNRRRSACCLRDLV